MCFQNPLFKINASFQQFCFTSKFVSVVKQKDNTTIKKMYIVHKHCNFPSIDDLDQGDVLYTFITIIKVPCTLKAKVTLQNMLVCVYFKMTCHQNIKLHHSFLYQLVYIEDFRPV